MTRLKDYILNKANKKGSCCSDERGNNYDDNHQTNFELGHMIDQPFCIVDIRQIKLPLANTFSWCIGVNSTLQ